MICIFQKGERRFELLTENWMAIDFLSYKSISVLRMSCVRDIVEIHKEVVDEEVE